MTSSQDVACPPRDRLVDFLLGHLPEAELAVLEHHLSACGACGDTLRALNAEDTLVALTRSAQVESSEDAVVEGLIERMRELHSGVNVGHDEAERVRDERAEGIRNLFGPPEGPDELGRLASYRVLGHLGTGGMGVVFEVEDEKLKRPVALKVLRPSLGAGARDRFLQEARAAAAIDHENVVTIYEVGEDEGLAYLAMQRLDGETLESLIKREGKLPADQCLRIGRQIALGLRASHAENLIHRDIKPANIWLEPTDGRVKLLDFGLARVLDDAPQLTESGMIAGTPAYMSPEQARGERVDARSDLFSLGCVLYRLVTGRLPFEGTNALATLRAIEQCDPKPLDELEPGVPESLAELVMWLLRKDPNERPQSADVVVESLDEIDRGDWRSGIAASPGARQTRPARARSIGRWFVGLAVIILLGVSGYFAGPTVISIAMNRGELVIETNDPNVKIEILEDGEVYRIIDLRTEQAVDLTAGEYGIQLAGVTEGWSLSTDRFTLRRGGKEIVEVRHRSGEAGSKGTGKSPSSEVLTYDGKTIEEWLAESNIERKPERLADAVRAFAVLADEESAKEAAQAVFRWMRRYDTSSADSSPRGRLIEASREFLWRMPTRPVVEALLHEIKHGNDKSRGFVSWMSYPPHEYGLETQQLVAIDQEMQRRAGEILSAALDLARDEANDSGNWALYFVANFCQNYEISPMEVDGLIPLCQEALSSGNTSRILAATRILVTSAPDSEGLVDSLISVLSDETVDSRLAAVMRLGKLGPQAAPAVPKLVDMLAAYIADGADLALFIPEGWRPMGGGMPLMDGAPDLRLEIVRTLGRIGPDAEAALPVLRNALEGSDFGYDSEVREAVVQIEGGSRGENWTVTVDQVRDPSAPAWPLTYGGKTLEQWLAESNIERKPEHLADAVRAFALLADEETATEAAKVVFRWMRRYDSSSMDSSPRGQLIRNSWVYLWSMPAESVVEAMLDEIKTGNNNSRDFVSFMAFPPVGCGHEPRQLEAVKNEMRRRADQITSAALALPRGESADHANWGLYFAIQFCESYEIDPVKLNGLIPRCQEKLPSDDSSAILAVSQILVPSAPDSEGLVDSLISVLSDETVYCRLEAVKHLGNLGPRAAPAVPKLVDLLSTYLAEGADSSLYAPEDWQLYSEGTPTGQGPPDLRVEIARALGKIGRDAAAALPVLHDLLKKFSGYARQVDIEKAIAQIKGGSQVDNRSDTGDEEASPPSSPLTYSGKTLEEWLAESSMEREPTRLAEVVRAFEVLVDDESAPEVAQTVLEWMRRYNPTVGGRVDLLNLGATLETLLWQMPSEAIVEAMLKEINAGNDNSRRFVSWVAFPRRDPARIPKHFETIVKEMKRRADEILAATQELARNESADADSRGWAQEFVIQFCGTYGIDAKEVEGLVLLCQEELSSGDSPRVLAASRVLVQSAPDSDGLVDALLSVLSEPNTGNRFRATECLGELGARAAPAAPMLVSLLRHYANGNVYVPYISGEAWRIYEPTDLELRPAIIRTLGKIGPDAKAALPVLREGLGGSLGDRSEIEKAIARIEGGAKEDVE